MKIKKIASETIEGLIADWLKALILALPALLVPYWGYVTDHWSWPVVFGAAIVLFAAGLSIYRGWPVRRYVKSAALTLQVHHDARQPTRVSAKNIGRYYLYKVQLNLQYADGRPPDQITKTFLFVTFDPWLLVGTLALNGRNMQLPHYITPKVDSDAAIIVFDGELPAGELELSVD